MSELVLHIGIPETGNKALQAFFSDNRDLLKKHGWVYPELTEHNSHLGLEYNGFKLRSFCLDIMNGREINLLHIVEDENLNKLKEAVSSYPYVLMSNSGLSSKPFLPMYSHIYNSVEIYWRAVSAVLEQLDLDRVRIIIYLQRQDEWIVSRWKTGVETGFVKKSFSEYISDPRWTQLSHYNDLIESIERGLKVPYELMVRVYDRQLFADENIVLDFCDAVGIPWDSGYSITKEDINPSISLDVAEALRSVDDYSTPNKNYWKNHLIPLALSLSRQHPDSPGLTPFSEEEEKEYLSYYEVDNKLVADRFFAREELFSSEHKEETIKWLQNNARVEEYKRLFQEECRRYLLSEENRITIRLAGYKVCLLHPHLEMIRTFSDYLDNSDSHIDFSVDMASLMNKGAETDPHLPLLHELFKRNVVLFHSSSFSYQGKAYLLVAESGGGKSTLARLFSERYPDETQIINDDLPLLRFDSDRIYVCGSPWQGKHNIGENMIAPLCGIFILSKGSENKLSEADHEEIYRSFLSAIRYGSSEPDAKMSIFAIIDRLSQKIPVYQFSFVNSEDAADELLKAVYPQKI